MGKGGDSQREETTRKAWRECRDGYVKTQGSRAVMWLLEVTGGLGESQALRGD